MVKVFAPGSQALHLHGGVGEGSVGIEQNCRRRGAIPGVNVTVKGALRGISRIPLGRDQPGGGSGLSGITRLVGTARIDCEVRPGTDEIHADRIRIDRSSRVVE